MPQTNQHKARKVYAFNLSGELLKEYTSVKQCAEQLGLKPSAASQAIKRQSVVDGRLYLSYGPKAPAARTKSNHNPLLSRRIINQASGAHAWMESDHCLDYSFAV